MNQNEELYNRLSKINNYLDKIEFTNVETESGAGVDDGRDETWKKLENL